MLKRLAFGGVGLILLGTPLIAAAQTVQEQIDAVCSQPQTSEVSALCSAIQDALARITAYQGQTGGTTSGSSGSSSGGPSSGSTYITPVPPSNVSFCHTFPDSDPTPEYRGDRIYPQIGDRGEDAAAVVRILVLLGYLPEDNQSLSYDEDVAAGMRLLQERYRLEQTGNVGPGTRAVLHAILNEQYRCGNNQTTTDPVITSLDIRAAAPTQDIISSSRLNGERTGTITAGTRIVLSWSSSNTTLCTASGGWSGRKGTANPLAVSYPSDPSINGPFTPYQTTTYTLTCTGAGGEVTRSVTVNIAGQNSGTPITPTSPTGPGSVSISTDPASPSLKLVAGGSTGVTLGIFRFRASGEDVALQTMRLSLTSGNPQDLISVYIYDSSNVLRGTATFVGNDTTAVATLLSPLSLTKDRDETITIKGDISDIGVSQPGTSGNLIKVNFVDESATGYGVTTGSTVTANGNTTVAGVRIFNSFPMIRQEMMPGGGLLSAGKLMRFSVTANTAGDVGIDRFTFQIDKSSSLVVAGLGLYAYTDAGYSTPINGQGANGLIGTTVTVTFPKIQFGPSLSTSRIEVPAGQTYYFELRGSVGGIVTSSDQSITTTLLGDAAYDSMKSASGVFGNFVWSPNTLTTSSAETTDWTNGSNVLGLPSRGIAQTVTASGITPVPHIPVTPDPSFPVPQRFSWGVSGADTTNFGTPFSIYWRAPAGYSSCVIDYRQKSLGASDFGDWILSAFSGTVGQTQPLNLAIGEYEARARCKDFRGREAITMPNTLTHTVVAAGTTVAPTPTPVIRDVTAPAGDPAGVYAGERAFIYGINLRHILIHFRSPNTGERVIDITPSTYGPGAASLDFFVPSSLPLGVYDVTVTDLTSGLTSRRYSVTVRASGPGTTTTPVPTVQVRPSSAPIINVSVNDQSSDQNTFSLPSVGSKAYIRWNVTDSNRNSNNGTTCAAAGNGVWGDVGNNVGAVTGSGIVKTSGEWTTPPLYATSTYGIRCENSLGTTYKYLYIGVPLLSSTSGGPGIDIRVDPMGAGSRKTPLPEGRSYSLGYGQKADIGWSVWNPVGDTPLNTTGISCFAAGNGLGGRVGYESVSLSGVWTTPALYTDTTYGIQCKNSAGAATTRYVSIDVGEQTNTSTVPSITVTYPDAGEIWQTGLTLNVIWRNNGFTPRNMRVLLNGTVNGFASIVLANLGASTQTSLTTGTIPNVPSGNYTIAVCDEGTPSPIAPAKPLCGNSAQFSINGAATSPMRPTSAPIINVSINGRSYDRYPLPAVGATITIAWNVKDISGNTTNDTICKAAGNGIWGNVGSGLADADGSGRTTTSGTWTTPPLFTNTTYGIQCTNSLGTSYKYLYIDVPALGSSANSSGSAPVITITPSTTRPGFGGTVNFRWQVTPVTDSTGRRTVCYASGTGLGDSTTGYIGAELKSPLLGWDTPALYTDVTYGMQCTNAGGTTTKYVPIDVGEQTSTATINVTLDGDMVDWESSNAASCKYQINGGLWTNLTPLTGSLSLAGYGQTANIVAVCTNSAGQDGPQARITYTPPAPTVRINQNSSSGSSVTITWSADNADSCVIQYNYSPDNQNFNGWTDFTRGGSSGSASAESLTSGTWQARAMCTGPGGTTTTNLTPPHTVAMASRASQTASAAGAFPEGEDAFIYTWNNDLQLHSSRAEDIKALQTALSKDGVYIGEDIGVFGMQTYYAVKRFQEKYGINPTGFVGPKTRAKLNELY